MKINALNAGAEVNIEIIAQEKVINLKTDVLEAAEGTMLYNTEGRAFRLDVPRCLVKLIMVKDTAVKFQSGRYKLKVYASYENAHYLWNNVRIEIVVLPGGQKCHAIFSEQEGIRVNRRGSYRLYVGKRIPVQFGVDGRPKEVLLKDISVNGVGFVVPEDFNCREGMPIRFTFKDTYYALSLSLQGTVVRVTPLPESGLLVGCQLSALSPTLEKYIYDTQRTKLQAQRQGGKRTTR